MGTKLRWHVKEERVYKDETWVEGVHHARVESIFEDHTEDGRLVFKTRLRVVGPEKYRGQSIFEDYYIGTQEDPSADSDQTWAQSVGWRRFKEFANSFDFEPAVEDFEDLAIMLKGKEFLPYVEPTSFFSKKEGKQKVKGKVVGFYKLGSRPIGATNGQATEVAAGNPAPPKPRFTVTPIADEAE